MPQYKVLADGYEITGGRESPLRAVVSYLVPWADAFDFYNTVLGQTAAATPTVAAIVRSAGLAFPASPNLCAESAKIVPCGAGGDPISAEMLGLSPGQYWSHAKITVTFSAPTYDQVGDDPRRQLDPDNPITYCEQEVEAASSFITEKASGWEFDDDSDLPGPFARLKVESRLVLTFPRVPFLPWRAIKPYFGTVNSVAIFDYDVGCLLLETVRVKASNTNQGLAGTSTQLVFAGQDYDWNKLRKKDGSLALVRNKADNSQRLFKYKDPREIFL